MMPGAELEPTLKLAASLQRSDFLPGLLNCAGEGAEGVEVGKSLTEKTD